MTRQRHRDDEDFPSPENFPTAEHHAADLDGKNAAAVFELQLAGERKISTADGRVPMSERYPGQGTARRFTS